MRYSSSLLLAPLFFLFEGCCLFGDCIEDDVTDISYSDYEPIIFDRDQLDGYIQLLEPRPIDDSGKIYVKDNLLFVGEDLKGFHVFDNTNPQNPIKINFIEVAGSTDLAIRDDVLYINQATDLVTARFDLDSPSLEVTKRVENTFPELLSPDGWYADVPENSVVVGWALKN